jgi:hypothetical protein
MMSRNFNNKFSSTVYSKSKGILRFEYSLCYRNTILFYTQHRKVTDAVQKPQIIHRRPSSLIIQLFRILLRNSLCIHQHKSLVGSKQLFSRCSKRRYSREHRSMTSFHKGRQISLRRSCKVARKIKFAAFE